MRKTFVMRGQTASGLTEILNFSGYKPGYAYRMTAFDIYPSGPIGDQSYELAATITAAKTFEDPQNPNFNNEGLIGVSLNTGGASDAYPETMQRIINDTFLITQNLIIAVIDTKAGSPMAVNWQCRFESVKMTGPQEATVNYKQFAISDE